MKRIIHVLAALSLLFSCASENGFNDDQTVSPAKEIPAGAVDLGMVMTRADGSTYRLYWAKSNLSDTGLCIYPEDYGDYYAWGEVEAKTDYSWSTYKFRTSGDSWENAMFSKYNAKESCGLVDNKTTLETGPDGDDAASKKLGGKWRMPTDAEWIELFSTCSLDWIFQHGVNGGLLTAANGNSIFLPAAGYRDETGLVKARFFCYYWSSYHDPGMSHTAYRIYFDRDQFYGSSYGHRSYGLSIRPVYEE